MPEALRLAETVAARICHDLAGLAGSIGQMLVLAEADDEALAVAKDANVRLVRQLRLLRLAFAPGELSASLDDLTDLFADRPVRPRFDLRPDTMFLAPTARVLANVFLIAEAGLPKGGAIVVGGLPDALTIRLDGPTARWPDGLAACLAGDDSAMSLSPRLVPMATAALAARGAGISLSMLIPVGDGSAPVLLLRGP